MPLVLLKLGVDESFSLFDNQENKVFDFFGVFFYGTEYLSTSPLFGEKKMPTFAVFSSHVSEVRH